MQDGRVQIVDVNLVLDGVVSEFIRGAVDDAGLEAAAGHPHREAERIVIAADFLCVHIALRAWRTAELAAAEHDRLVEQSAALQVLQ